MSEPKRPLKVFLCHAHADRDPVRELYTRLTQDGVDAWLDKAKLLPGQDWELEIRKAVREADVVVVCLSKQFNQAGFRQKEVRLALDTAMEKPEGEIFIIPARLEECDNLESLRKWHWVNLFEDDGYENLLRALKLRADKIGVLLRGNKKTLVPSSLKNQKVDIAPDKWKWNYLTVILLVGILVLSAIAMIGYQFINNPPKSTPSPAVTTITKVVSVTDTEYPSITPTESFQYFGKTKFETTVSIYSIPERFDSSFVLIVSPNEVFSICQNDSENNSYLIARDQVGCFEGNPLGWVNQEAFITFDNFADANNFTPMPLDMEINNNGIFMRLIPAGEFVMGSTSATSTDEKPAHNVYLDAFYIDKFEVTNHHYRLCVEAGICNAPYKIDSDTRSSYYDNPAFLNYPVINVDWDMAKVYCEWRSGYLPTEAEWEKAARGSDSRIYPWGETIDCFAANYRSCAEDTLNVGSFENGKSPFGVYDMAGNVWEWVADLYSSIYYGNSPYANPIGPEDENYNIIRGGAYDSSVTFLRSANREKKAISSSSSTPYSDNIGFRCVLKP